MKHIKDRLIEAVQLASVDVRESDIAHGTRIRRLRSILAKVSGHISGISLWRKYCGQANRQFMNDNFTVVRYVVETQGRLSLFDGTTPKESRPQFDRMCGAIVAVYEPLTVRDGDNSRRVPGRLLRIGASFCPVKHQHRFSKRETLFRAIRSLRPLNMGWMDHPSKLPSSLYALLFDIVGNDAPSTLLRNELPDAAHAVASH